MFSDRFKNWLESSEIKVNEGYYSRDEAYGQVHYLLFTPSSVTEDRTVLFVHGTGNDATFQTESIFQSLLEMGLPVFSFDLDGHGVRSSTIFQPQSIVSAPEAAYRMICKLLPKTKNIDLVGVSLGGTIGLLAAANANIPVKRLVMIGAPLKTRIDFRSVTFEALSFCNRESWRYSSKWGFKSILPGVGPFGRKRFPIRLNSVNGGFDYVNQLNRFLNEYKDTFKNLNLPQHLKALALYGQWDFMIDPEYTIPILEQYPEVEVRILPKTNHFLSPVTPKTADFIQDFLIIK